MSIEQNQKVQEYLNNVCSHIKWTEVHEQVKLELLSHIEDCVLEYSTEGVSHQEVIEMAIDRMGEPVVLGKQLHRYHKPPINWSLLSIVAIMAGMGLFTLYSMEMHGLLMKDVSIFAKSVIYLFLGLVVLIGVTYYDYRKLKAYGSYLFVGTMLVWLILLLLSKTVNGKPYLNLGFISISYIDIAPVLLAIALAGIFYNKDWSKPKWFASTVFLLIVPNIFYVISNSMAAAVIYTVVFLTLMLISGASRKQFVGIAVIPVGLLVFALFLQPYRWNTILKFINPYNDHMGSGYIYIQSVEAIKSAGLWGQGFAFSGNLPELHTNLIFSYIVYTFGWVAGISVIVLALALIAKMAGLIKQLKDEFGRLLVAGLTVIVALHFLWNVLMTVGFAPTSGIGLPFISYGGSQAVINMLLIGLVLSVYRRKNLFTLPMQVNRG